MTLRELQDLVEDVLLPCRKQIMMPVDADFLARRLACDLRLDDSRRQGIERSLLVREGEAVTLRLIVERASNITNHLRDLTDEGRAEMEADHQPEARHG